MILEYGVKNFCCFKEWIDISFKVSANCPDLICHDKPVTNILCVKGANGSGKTNALKALSFLVEFCKNSFSYKPDAKIPLETFFYNVDPTEFFLEFVSNDITYRYELVLSEKEIISETFYRKHARFTKIVERKGIKLVKCAKDYKELEVVKLRSNASLISTAHQYEISVFNPIYDFFNKIVTNVNFFGHLGENIEVEKASEFYHDHNYIFEFVKELILKFDSGIRDIELKTTERDDGVTEYSPLFSYDIEDKKKYLTYLSQSSGTKSLYLQLASYKAVLDAGGVLVLDEFDTKLHPHILPILLKIFTDIKSNKDKAQLIFSTHNAEILDILGKYRTYLINKEDNESYGYRLDEIPGDIIRNDRPLMPIYNSGKIGGVPKI
jgi:AAA15 family ATPase/GTPase